MAIFVFAEGRYTPGHLHSALGCRSAFNYEKEALERLEMSGVQLSKKPGELQCLAQALGHLIPELSPQKGSLSLRPVCIVKGDLP